MTIVIICEDLCNDCAVNFRKDPFCSGDYGEGGNLLRFCPRCGQMLPYLDKIVIPKKVMSNKLKKRIGVRIAKKNNLDYTIMGDIIKNLRDIRFEGEFTKQFKAVVKAEFNIDLSDSQIS